VHRRDFLLNSIAGAVLSSNKIRANNSVGGQAARSESQDAYAFIDEKARTLVLGTAVVQAKLQLSRGKYLLKSLLNKTTHREYVSENSVSEDFRVTVDGKTITGASGDWRWVSAGAKVLSDGEIKATVRLENELLQVERAYVVYAGTGIIRQWATFQNRSDSTITLSNPYMLDLRLSANEAANKTLSYMTGGGDYSGSQILKQVPLTPSYSRTFDSTDKPEIRKVEGLEFGYVGQRFKPGSGIYMPWFDISDPRLREGVFFGLDYYGHWAAEIGNFQGAPGYIGLRLGGYKKLLRHGESVGTPKTLTGVYTGDLDDMGNQLKGWQYRYMWDFTSDAYFTKIRYLAEMRWEPGKGSEPWGGGTEDNWDFRLYTLFHTADVMGYVGADILWQDAGWHDYMGDNDGPDLLGVNRYLAKSRMRLAVWWPLWYASKHSKVAREHPEWGGPGLGLFKRPFDTSRPEVIQWMSNQLDQKVAAWGNFQWREDGTAVAPVGTDETPMLAQYNNIIEMQKQFRKRHPECSIDLCSGGGNLMSFEGLRLADVSQLTDGGSLVFGNYYSSYLFPPDKIDDWTRIQNSTPINVATTLTMAPSWAGDRGLYGHEPGILQDNGMENLRQTFEIYHYLVREGVAGRWVQIYHPKVDGDSPIFYLERLSRDGRRGVIILKHFIAGQIRIYPKGLQRAEIYDVRFRIAKSTAKRTGEELTQNGITLINPQPGELIYLGLPNHPGSGTDTVPPTAPAHVTKSLGTNVGVTGVELQWTESTDNNWLSYYQIYRDGEPIGRVSTGLFYFDHSDSMNLGAVYEVQAVDGDGNASEKVKPVQIGDGSLTYTALGGYLAGKDYSYQGANGWWYEEWNGDRRTRAIWNGALRHMGLYEGTSGDGQLLIGGSWMRPSRQTDAVRVFVVPYFGKIRVRGTVRKDIYHTHGNGVRVKVLKGDQQVWPDAGWETIAADDTMGKEVDQTISVSAGDKLYFIVNSNGDATDDETVWNPEIQYVTTPEAKGPTTRTRLDDVDYAIQYSGGGWQHLGTPPWTDGRSLGADIGYLHDRFEGTLSVSGTQGDKLTLKFHGTGIKVIGDTGSDRGIAAIKLDGKDMASIDTFVPERYIGVRGKPLSSVREPHNIPKCPPIVLWATAGLTEGDHTFELTVTGQKNAQSTGTFVGVDEFVIEGNAVDPPRDSNQFS
jgi:hypothetical protein